MAALEILALDTATPQIEAPQTGDTYSAPRAVSIAPESLTGTAATTSLDIAQTWNTTGTPTAVKLNVTDTASNAASLLMDLQTGGTSRFSVDKAGAVTLPAGASNSAPSLKIGTNVGLYSRVSGSLNFGGIGNWTVELVSGEGIRLGSNQIGWGTTVGGNDVVITRDAANTLAQRNTTNAQTFRLYNTFTNVTTNHERLAITWSSNVAYIQTEKGSTTGTLRPLVVNHGAVAFSALPTPSASIEGARAYITDSDVTTFGANVAGGGANKMPVWCDGTNWKVG